MLYFKGFHLLISHSWINLQPWVLLIHILSFYSITYAINSANENREFSQQMPFQFLSCLASVEFGTKDHFFLSATFPLTLMTQHSFCFLSGDFQIFALAQVHSQTTGSHVPQVASDIV